MSVKYWRSLQCRGSSVSGQNNDGPGADNDSIYFNGDLLFGGSTFKDCVCNVEHVCRYCT